MSKRENRKALKRFLNQYYRGKCREHEIANRISIFTDRSDSAEFLDDLKRQAQSNQERLKEIMCVISYLPELSIERSIFELRHLDLKSWTQVEMTVHLTTTPCIAHYNKGLDFLLEIPEVQELIRGMQNSKGL